MRAARTVPALLVTLLTAGPGCRSEAARGASAEIATAGPADPDHAALRRLWVGADYNFFASSPSPDGRYVTEIDWTTGDLAVRDLRSGALHRLTDKGPWAVSSDFAEVARFTSDGRGILYGWFNDATGTYEMRMMDFRVDDTGRPHGSGSRVIHAGEGVYVFWLFDWLSDDEILTGIYRPDDTTALAFLSVSTGALRVLRSFDWRDARAALSPDGRFVAYDHATGEDPRDRDIHVLSTHGSLDVPLIARRGRDAVLGWLPAGDGLLFYSEADGPAVWRLPVSDGVPAGEAVRVSGDVRNLEPLGFAGSTLYYGVEVETPTFRTATIDFEGRRLVPAPTVFAAPGGATTVRALDWSPDGEHVVHDIDLTGRPSSWIAVRSAHGEAIREWHFELRLLRSILHWADGDVFLSARDGRGRAGFFRMDLESGELELVRRHGAGDGRVFTLSADATELYFTRAVGDDRDRRVEIVGHGLAKGTTRVLHRIAHHDAQLGAGHWSPLAPSPDGRSMAWVEPLQGGASAIRVLALDGGQPRTVHTVHPPAAVSGLVGWQADGQSLLILVRPDPGAGIWSTDDVELVRVFQDGAAEHIAVIADYAGGATLHPDGVTLAYRAGRPRGEIWALEGLGPRSADDPVARQ